ncbi:hypothetical protein [Roseomonas sp. BN140053]|uniref:hypothetical protein n=1 Tax=Roseomonas sp. BN140053 TaxID=3391898 RepID=UPI0039E758B8
MSDRSTEGNRWFLRGRCRKFGDDVPLDGGLMPFRFAIGRVTDPAELIPHLCEEIRPGFHAEVRRGDILLAGRNFCAGKAHFQGLLAIEALGLGIVCESMPYNSRRIAVATANTFLTDCAGCTALAEEGDELEVDFATGRFANLSRGTVHELPPMDSSLRDIVAAGGSKGVIRAWLAAHPEQGVAA